MITSSSNKKIKEIHVYQKKAVARKKDGIFIIEGAKIFAELDDADIVDIYVTEDFLEHASFAIQEKIRRNRYELVTDAIFSSISDTKTPQGILSIVKQKHYTLERILEKEKEKINLLILENVQDPGNVGTMFRMGEGSGVTGIILSRDCVDVYNPKVVRSTMGSLLRLPFVYTDDIIHEIEIIKSYGIQVYATVLGADTDYVLADYTKSSAFIIGNEASGISQEAIRCANTCIKIPMLGQVESLNAAMAAGILEYELARQRRMGTERK